MMQRSLITQISCSVGNSGNGVNEICCSGIDGIFHNLKSVLTGIFMFCLQQSVGPWFQV